MMTAPIATTLQSTTSTVIKDLSLCVPTLTLFLSRFETIRAASPIQTQLGNPDATVLWPDQISRNCRHDGVQTKCHCRNCRIVERSGLGRLRDCQGSARGPRASDVVEVHSAQFAAKAGFGGSLSLSHEENPRRLPPRSAAAHL